MPSLTSDEKELWDNDEIQFARLLCEIVASSDETDIKHMIKEVSVSMDLTEDQVNEIFDRAEMAWGTAQIKINYLKSHKGAPLRGISGASEVEGQPGHFLVTLFCGHKKFTNKKLAEYYCLTCPKELS